MLRSLVGSEMCIRDRAGTPTIEGENPQLWEYTAGSQITSNLSAEVAATLIYNGTNNLVLGASRIDGDIVVADLGTGGQAITIEVIIASNSSPQESQILYRGTIAGGVTENGTYRFSATNEMDMFTFTQGQPLFLFLQETGTSVNFTYTVEDIRWSYTADEFNVIGGGDTQLIQHTDTPDEYTGAASAVLRVNGAATAVEFDPIVNTYPNGTTLLNDISIPSAEYVLDAVDPVFNYTMPLLTRDFVANQRYDICLLYTSPSPRDS